MFFNLFNSFSTGKCFYLFEVILLRLNSLASKSVLDIKFACANLVLKTAANLFNSEISIYLS